MPHAQATKVAAANGINAFCDDVPMEFVFAPAWLFLTVTSVESVAELHLRDFSDYPAK
jgi:hypothetical protein